MTKTIFIMIDGCPDQLARESMGFLEHMAEGKKAARYFVRGELPAMSRPIYETLLTGLCVSEHGIVNNYINRRSRHKNIFSICKEQGLTTAAAAYCWISELYSRAAFLPFADRIQSDKDSAIQNGIFYFEDDYPDSHTISDAEYLRQTYDPDFLMIHTMSIDHAGHRFGGGSKEQAAAAMAVDVAISMLLPQWLEQGYNILVTSDHGMGANGIHSGNTQVQRTVPLYLFAKEAHKGVHDKLLSQLTVAPLLCALLGIKPAGNMMPLTECGVDFFA